jgi:hypothetical protein
MKLRIVGDPGDVKVQMQPRDGDRWQDFAGPYASTIEAWRAHRKAKRRGDPSKYTRTVRSRIGVSRLLREMFG